MVTNYSSVQICENGNTRSDTDRDWIVKTYRLLHFSAAHEHCETKIRQTALALLGTMNDNKWTITNVDVSYHLIRIVVEGDDAHEYILRLTGDNKSVTKLKKGLVMALETSVSQGGDRA